MYHSVTGPIKDLSNQGDRTFAEIDSGVGPCLEEQMRPGEAQRLHYTRAAAEHLF